MSKQAKFNGKIWEEITIREFAKMRKHESKGIFINQKTDKQTYFKEVKE